MIFIIWSQGYSRVKIYGTSQYRVASTRPRPVRHPYCLPARGYFHSEGCDRPDSQVLLLSFGHFLPIFSSSPRNQRWLSDLSSMKESCLESCAVKLGQGQSRACTLCACNPLMTDTLVPIGTRQISILFLKGSTDPFCNSRWSPIQLLIMHPQPGHRAQGWEHSCGRWVVTGRTIRALDGVDLPRPSATTRNRAELPSLPPKFDLSHGRVSCRRMSIDPLDVLDLTAFSVSQALQLGARIVHCPGNGRRWSAALRFR